MAADFGQLYRGYGLTDAVFKAQVAKKIPPRQ
jgi:hypothetical protein